MKNNQIAQVLLGVLLVMALFSAWLSLSYWASLRKLQRLQTQIIQVNAFNTLFNSLYNDSHEYAQHHPDLAAVVQAVGKAHLANAAKPAGK